MSVVMRWHKQPSNLTFRPLSKHGISPSAVARSWKDP